MVDSFIGVAFHYTSSLPPVGVAHCVCPDEVTIESVTNYRRKSVIGGTVPDSVKP